MLSDSNDPRHGMIDGMSIAASLELLLIEAIFSSHCFMLEVISNLYDCFNGSK